ncbi:hypothetical protein [Aureibacter tunicatorum]|uniref:Cytochrome bd-type quinol oxidase subunit 2 n=1 Tax=Aureibacter tunicatorum TaxID=866807 RepID=A0AAE3XMB8_9BACT|nr:hypothetical protein [Aureibacter tunicatorum]MDR6238574.1 cytochrome bd-type quinol oxidase subunit 2 [Aureibacter tunicatorum]BDD05495.1 hypothetical protein AUTU_29780 [Aureibacter tunicatorum]
MNLSLEYLNGLANQILLISSLLGGFSIAIVSNLLTDKTKGQITNRIFQVTTLAAGSFLVSVFAMTKIVMMTTKGYPENISSETLETSNIIGSISFLLGITFLCFVIVLSGWTKSKQLGIFTTIVGIITFTFIFMTITNIA